MDVPLQQGDTDPDPDHLVGTMTFDFANPPAALPEIVTAYSATVDFDLWLDHDGDGNPG